MATIFNTKLYPKVETSLNKKESIRLVDSTLRSYMEKNSAKLSDIAPMHQIIFGELEKKGLFKALDLTHEEVYKCMLESPDVVIKGRAQTINSFNVSMALGIRYAMLNNNTDLYEKLLVLYALSFYPSLYSKYFKYDPKEEIMQYVVNNMTNRFKLKQLGLFGVIKATVEKCVENNINKIKRGHDVDIVYFILDTKNRYNSFFNNIMDEFKKAHTNGKFVNLDSEDLSDENYRETDNTMMVASRMADKVMMHLSINGPTDQFIIYSAKICQVSISDMRNWVGLLLNTKKEESNLRQFIEGIVTLYLYEGKNKSDSIKSSQFLIKSLEEFKKTNSSNKTQRKLKELSSKWLNEYTDIPQKSNRAATLIQYRRAIYTFFVLTIQSRG